MDLSGCGAKPRRHWRLGFLPGKASSGATSILWTLVLFVNHRLLGLEPVAYTWAVNLVLLAGTVVALFWLARDDLLNPLNAALLAMTPALFGNYVWLSASGMESLLLAFLSVLAVLLWRRSSLSTGAICALAVLTRPEAIGLPLVLTAADYLRTKALPFRGLLRLWAPVTLAVGGSALLSWSTSGGILPTTMEGRRWLYGFDGPSFQLAWAFARRWGMSLVAISLGWPMWLLPLVLALVFVGGWSAFRRLPKLATLCVWALAADVLYAVLLPSAGHGGRYQPLNLLLAPVLAALGLAEAASWLVRDHRVRKALLPASEIAVALGCLPSLWLWRVVTAAGVEHIDHVHVVMAKWVRDEIPAKTPIAAFDIGAMGYFSGHPVVDLGGLVERSYVPYLLAGRVPVYLREQRLSLVVLPAPYESSGYPDVGRGLGLDVGRGLGLVGNPTLTLLPLAEAASPRALWRMGFVATGHASPRLVAYEIQWP